MHDFKISVQDYIHRLNEINKVNVFFKMILHQTSHIEKSKIFQFHQINILNMVIKKRLQNHHCLDRYETTKYHLS